MGLSFTKVLKAKVTYSEPFASHQIEIINDLSALFLISHQPRPVKYGDLSFVNVTVNRCIALVHAMYSMLLSVSV